jgi:hypothetical protein
MHMEAGQILMSQLAAFAFLRRASQKSLSIRFLLLRFDLEAGVYCIKFLGGVK